MKSITLGKFLFAFCTAALVAQSVAADPAPPKPKPVISRGLTLRPTTPEEDAHYEQVYDISQAGKTALKAKNFAIAEEDFREILSDNGGYAYFGLAEALTGEGKTEEALHAYQQLFDPHIGITMGGSYFPKMRLEYAFLLNQTGQWDKAIDYYEKALPDLPSGTLPKVDVQFVTDTPQPRELEAAIHVALGLLNNFGGEADSNVKAMQEYQKALQLEPNWPIANFYYGFGWQQISPADQAKFGSAAQAKAALQKAVKIGKGPVKKAAQKALLMAMKTK